MAGKIVNHEQLIYPAALLFTEGGTYIVRPEHYKLFCTAGNAKPNLACPGCRYDQAVRQLLSLVDGEPTEEQLAAMKQARSHSNPERRKGEQP